MSLKTLNLSGLPALLSLALAIGCASHVAPTAAPPDSRTEAPAAAREFRGLWVATVANIDWPSAPGLPVPQQQAEARELVALARATGLNAIILQVRPAADALYASPLEPWSEYLTGNQGLAPEPFYDPLAFWIEEAHRAGLELHAWFNPYRARHSSSKSLLAPSHVSNTRPGLVKAYGDQLWLDPGKPGSAEHALAVVLDVVRRYDVDGVHIDDYFYPYPIEAEPGRKLDFPDEESWQAYLAGGGGRSRADWRRGNVDALVERLYREVHRAKPQVRVGVSPFGVGRPDRRPPGIAGFSQYDEIYADAELWLEQGWMDYLAPQLYWQQNSPGQPFSPLLDYWRAQNPKGRHVWPGLFTSRIGSAKPWPATEIAEQVQLTRAQGGSTGQVHFSAVALKKDYGGIRAVLAGLYASPALVPASPWLGGNPPPIPAVRLSTSKADPDSVQVEADSKLTVFRLAVWGRYGRDWSFFVLPGGGGDIPARSSGRSLDLAVVSAVDRNGLESPRGVAVDARY